MMARLNVKMLLRSSLVCQLGCLISQRAKVCSRCLPRLQSGWGSFAGGGLWECWVDMIGEN